MDKANPHFFEHPSALKHNF